MSKIWTPEDIGEFEDKFSVYCILRSDGMYNINGNIDLKNQMLKDLSCLPPIHTIGGVFNCSYNLLTSLIGCPKVVNRDFYCSNNKLNTLLGGPEEIGMDFWCNHNNLTTFKNGPYVVGGSLFCYRNDLKL